DQRRGVRRLSREHQVEQDEWVGVEAIVDGGDVERDPQDDDNRLRREKPGRAQEARDGLREAPKGLGVVERAAAHPAWRGELVCPWHPWHHITCRANRQA